MLVFYKYSERSHLSSNCYVNSAFQQLVYVRALAIPSRARQTVERNCHFCHTRLSQLLLSSDTAMSEPKSPITMSLHFHRSLRSNSFSSAYPSLAFPVSGLLLRSTAFKINTVFLIYAPLTATDTNTSTCIASFFLWCHFTGVVLSCAFPLRTVRLYRLYPGL